MVVKVRLYIEGGGDHRRTQDMLREGLGQMLAPLRVEARHKGFDINIQPIVGGNCKKTLELFCRALEDHRDAINILLVDAEEKVTTTNLWGHLQRRKDNQLTKPEGAEENQCQLMVQSMETWIVADEEKLAEYYGKKKFKPNALPADSDLEQASVVKVAQALKTATKATQKGEYHKINHASALLKLIRLEVLCNKLKHCRILVDTLAKEVASKDTEKKNTNIEQLWLRFRR